MNINLAQFSNEELVNHVNACIDQYQKNSELKHTTNAQNPVYSNLSLKDFQQFDKHLQRCLAFGTDGASETATKVKQILSNDVGSRHCKIEYDPISRTHKQATETNQVMSMYEYHKSQGNVNRFFDVGNK